MPFIILDRDGVINYDSDAYIKSPDEWRPIPGSLEAIAKLNRFGYQVFIVTNQSGVARGLYDLQILQQIHEKLRRELAVFGGHINEIFFCPHHPEDNCNCRKPKPGLLFQIAKKYPIDLKNTYFIGDSLVDVQAAQAVGCAPILVLSGNGEKSLAKNPVLANVPHFNNLATAVDYVLSAQEEKHG